MKSSTPVLVAVLAIAVLCGCTQKDPVVIPEPEPSSAPIFESDEEALAAAEVAYGEYLKVSDAILKDGGRDPDRIRAVASENQAQAEIEGSQETMDEGKRGIGRSAFDRMSLQQYAPDSPEGKSIVTAYACLDLSGTDILDATGRSVLASDRPDVVPVELTFDADVQKRTLIVSSLGVWSGDNFCD